MRRITAGLFIAAALLPAAAGAKQRQVAPPGNSGVNQYVEVFPTAGGGRPSDSVHPGGTGGGGSGGGTSSSGSGGSGTLSSGTQRALTRAGADGQGAAALANATAPAHKAPKSGSGSHQGASNVGSGAGVQGSTTSRGAASPLTTLVRAITGSSNGGLGPLLPVLLVVVALGGGVLALIRRRRAT